MFLVSSFFGSIEMIFNIDFADMNVIYTHDNQVQNFLIDRLLQIC